MRNKTKQNIVSLREMAAQIHINKYNTQSNLYYIQMVVQRLHQ